MFDDDDHITISYCHDGESWFEMDLYHFRVNVQLLRQQCADFFKSIHSCGLLFAVVLHTRTAGSLCSACLLYTSSPPCALTFSFRAFRSSNSSTQGLQPLNQKFTTVKALPANRLLSTGLPSKSLPSNLGKALPCAAALEAASSAGALSLIPL